MNTMTTKPSVSTKSAGAKETIEWLHIAIRNKIHELRVIRRKEIEVGLKTFPITPVEINLALSKIILEITSELENPILQIESLIEVAQANMLPRATHVPITEGNLIDCLECNGDGLTKQGPECPHCLGTGRM